MTQDPARVPDIHPELRDALTSAQEQRGEREGMSSEGLPAWIAYERAVMIDATTALLVRHGLPLNSRDISQAVERSEQLACGHVDYTSKWALGCAEYVASIARAALGRDSAASCA